MGNEKSFVRDNSFKASVIEQDGVMWFKCLDITRSCGVTEYAYSYRLGGRHLTRLMSMDRIGRAIKMNFVNMEGLKFIFAHTRQEKAKEYKQWLTDEVFPQLGISWNSPVNPPKPEKIVESPKFKQPTVTMTGVPYPPMGKPHPSVGFPVTVKPIEAPKPEEAAQVSEDARNFIFCVAGNNPTVVMDALTKFMSGTAPMTAAMAAN